MEDSDSTDGFDRRTFMKATGAATGAAALGLTATGTAAAASFEGEFANVRVREAAKVWAERPWRDGYRGHPERAIGLTDSGIESRHPDLGPWNGVQVLLEDEDGDGETEFSLVNRTGGSTDPFAGITAGNVRPDTPKVVGWYDADDRYGSYDRPLDRNGHGTHCSSIMGGSGRASAVDESRLTQESPEAVLLPGDTRTYEVTAPAGTGVFVSAYGEALELAILGPDGRQLDRSTFQEGDATPHDDRTTFGSNVVADTPTVHEAGEATYTAVVRPLSGEAVTVGRCRRVAAGAFRDPDSTTGARAGDTPTVHAGLSPNSALVGLQGLSEPTVDLGTHAAEFASTFNLRAVNMSWGYVGGLPFGGAGLDVFGITSAIREMAAEGILTVAAAGNSNTPANGNGAPAVAEEAISVVATGPQDGIVDYSSGGIGGRDEDEGDFDSKPDVTAPGGGTTDLVNAAKNGDPSSPPSEQPPVRDHIEKAGTSMASPYTSGLAGLVAHAMDAEAGEAPDDIALPVPAEAGRADAMRLKATILATASETAFTAAPYHKAHVPTYEFGGRDPYEGFGRINPDAAVDAVTRDITATPDGGETVSGTVGFDVPEHSRAVAGYIDAEPGTHTVELTGSRVVGANSEMAKGGAHLDLFVYDAEAPSDQGEPTVVTRAQALDGGDAGVSFTVEEGGVHYVVAKLVNVPGVVNGYDVQVDFDLSTSFTPKAFVAGTRTDDSDLFTGGRTTRQTIDITDSDGRAVLVRDRIPKNWEVVGGEVRRVPGLQADFLYYDPDEDGVAEAATAPRFDYFLEAPDEADGTGEYEFGPVEVTFDTDPGMDEQARDWITVAGTTDRNVVVGQSTGL